MLCGFDSRSGRATDPYAPELANTTSPSRLTERDFAIITALAKHKIMTATMIEALFFPLPHAAAARLLTLYEMGVLARWRSPSSKAYRYVLDWRGQSLQAMRDEEKPPTKAAATVKAQHLFVSAHRPHTEGINAFYCHLARAARARGDVDVAFTFDSYSAVSAMRSDANLTLTWNDGRTLWFWFEHDRGTETFERLADKVAAYKSVVKNYHYDEAVLLIEVSPPADWRTCCEEQPRRCLKAYWMACNLRTSSAD